MRVLSVLNPTLDDYKISGAALLGINIANKMNDKETDNKDVEVDFIANYGSLIDLVSTKVRKPSILNPEVRSSRAIRDTIEYAVRIFKSGGYDVMHIHLHQMSVLSSIVDCIPENIPVVYTQHSSTILGRFSLGYRPSAYALTNIRRNIRIICPSNSMIDIWKEYIESDKIDNVRMIRNGVRDVINYQIPNLDIIDSDISDAYISVGRIDPNKGMLEAASMCAKSGKKLIVVGTLGMGSMKISDNAQKYYDDFKNICLNSDNIIWFNYMDNNNIRKLMNRCKGYISMSNKESFGLTVAEALSVGTPVLYLEESAINELTDDRSSMMIPRSEVYRKSQSKKIDIYSGFLNEFDNKINSGYFNSEYIINRAHDLGVTMKDCADNYISTYLDVMN